MKGRRELNTELSKSKKHDRFEQKRGTPTKELKTEFNLLNKIEYVLSFLSTSKQWKTGTTSPFENIMCMVYICEYSFGHDLNVPSMKMKSNALPYNRDNLDLLA